MTKAKPVGSIEGLPKDLVHRCPSCNVVVKAETPTLQFYTDTYIQEGFVYCSNHHKVGKAEKHPIYRLRDL